MRLAKSLRLTEKQASNAFILFAANFDAALQSMGNGFFNLETKERYKALIRMRAERLDME